MALMSLGATRVGSPPRSRPHRDEGTHSDEGWADVEMCRVAVEIIRNCPRGISSCSLSSAIYGNPLHRMTLEKALTNFDRLVYEEDDGKLKYDEEQARTPIPDWPDVASFRSDGQMDLWGGARIGA